MVKLLQKYEKYQSTLEITDLKTKKNKMLI